MKSTNFKYLVIALIIYFSSTVNAQNDFTLTGNVLNNDSTICQIFQGSEESKEWDYLATTTVYSDFSFTLNCKYIYLIIFIGNEINKNLYLNLEKESDFNINVDFDDNKDYIIYYDSSLKNYQLKKE